MRRVYFGQDNIITSLGFTTNENASRIKTGASGIKIMDDPAVSQIPVAYSSVDTGELERHCHDTLRDKGKAGPHFSRLEKMFLTSISRALKESGVDPQDPRTIMVFSTTKGNIDLISSNPIVKSEPSRLKLWQLAEFLSGFFKNPNRPLLVSNACTSGSVSIITASRLIASGLYDHAVVTGGDIVSEFVISGFQSFQALSPDACRPFDADRNGLSLGEGCGTLVLTCEPDRAGGGRPVLYLGGATSNDANHISGPSRDGEGLFLSVDAAMREAGTAAGDLDFISAHGTATPYNDEMESLALAWAGLENIPANSFKGYIGHTLGAAGVIETILSAWSIRNGILFQSAGYQTHGVSRPLNIIRHTTLAPVRKVLKTASGFGGCNAAIVMGTA